MLSNFAYSNMIAVSGLLSVMEGLPSPAEASSMNLNFYTFDLNGCGKTDL